MVGFDEIVGELVVTGGILGELLGADEGLTLGDDEGLALGDDVG